jgi:hypothetical protein
MMNKKVVCAITASVCLAIIASVGLGVYALSLSNKKNEQQNKKPLNRGNDYEQVNLSTKLDKSKIKDLIVAIDSQNHDKLDFNREKFKHNIESIIRDGLTKIDRFKNRVNEYQITISYQFTNPQTIALDVVWNIPTSNSYHYYDQFEISLKE